MKGWMIEMLGKVINIWLNRAGKRNKKSLEEEEKCYHRKREENLIPFWIFLRKTSLENKNK